MKYKLMTFLLIVTLSFAISNSESQAASGYHNAVSIDFVDYLIFKQLFATYEYQLSASNSITGILGYYNYDYGLYNDLKYSEITVGASYRWYLKGLIDDKKKPIEGLSVAPYALVSFGSFSNPYFTSGTYFSIGGEIAYKWVFDSWVVEPIFRLNMPINKIKGFSQYRSLFLGVNLGYAW